ADSLGVTGSDHPDDAELARANAWRVTSATLAVGVALSVAYAAESLKFPGESDSYIATLPSSSGTAVLAVLFVVMVAWWRRAAAGASSVILVAPVVAAAFAVISSAAERNTVGTLARCGSLLCASVAFIGFGMHLPCPAKGLEPRIRAIATKVLIGGT